MKKVLAKSAAAVLALLLAAGMGFFAACDSGTPPSEGYTAFYNAVQRKGGIDYEDLDDDNYGALDITVTAGKSSIAFAFFDRDRGSRLGDAVLIRRAQYCLTPELRKIVRDFEEFIKE